MPDSKNPSFSQGLVCGPNFRPFGSALAVNLKTKFGTSSPTSSPHSWLAWPPLQPRQQSFRFDLQHQILLRSQPGQQQMPVGRSCQLRTARRPIAVSAVLPTETRRAEDCRPHIMDIWMLCDASMCSSPIVPGRLTRERQRTLLYLLQPCRSRKKI